MCPKEHRHRPHSRSERSAGRALCRADRLGRVVESRRSRGACCQGHHHQHSTTYIKSLASEVTDTPKQPKVTATMKTARPLKPELPSPQQPLSRLLRSRNRKQLRVSKPRPPNTQPPTWWSPPVHSRESLISSIASPSKHVWR